MNAIGWTASFRHLGEIGRIPTFFEHALRNAGTERWVLPLATHLLVQFWNAVRPSRASLAVAILTAVSLCGCREQQPLQKLANTAIKNHEAAAEGAHVLTVHTGLAPVDAKSGRFANQSLIGSDILNRLTDGAVLINYDRGEVVDAEALDAALAEGKVSYACIDADLFRNAADGTLSGPLVPYRALEGRHSGKLELLPHAAADTDHPSRVEGARQAVDQIFDVIQYGVVTNLKGDLPPGYRNAGARTVNGIGAVTGGTLARAVADEAVLRQAREAVESLAAIWGALSSTTDPDRRATLLQRYGAALVRDTNRYTALTEKLGLRGPYAEA